jgi:hypothetical protein
MLNTLMPSTRRIIEETAELTGKQFRFTPVDKLNTHAKVKIARKTMKEHLVYYRSDCDESVNHLLAHECGHIIRTYRAPETERVVPYADGGHLLAMKQSVAGDPALEKIGLPPAQLEELLRIWHGGIVSQLTNQPVDIMIEKWLYADYPDLRGIQKQSLRSQWNEALKGLADNIRRTTPGLVYESSNLMNYAFFRHLGLAMGENFLKPYNNTHYVDRGKALAALLDTFPDNTFSGDLKKIAAWTDYLTLNGWFNWIDFEKIPEGYEEQV